MSDRNIPALERCAHEGQMANLVDRYQQWRGYECPYCEIDRLRSLQGECPSGTTSNPEHSSRGKSGESPALLTSKAVTVLTAAKITELTTKFPNLGIDTFIHERDYNQMANGREELRQRFERACARITELESAVETKADLGCKLDGACTGQNSVRQMCWPCQMRWHRQQADDIERAIRADEKPPRIEPRGAQKSNGDVCTCEKPEPALMDHGLASLCEKCYRPIGSQK